MHRRCSARRQKWTGRANHHWPGCLPPIWKSVEGDRVEISKRLEENNIICNYQATPDEEGFTAAGALRLGVSEMTRFGMEEKDFRDLAGLLYDVVQRDRKVGDSVKSLRSRFLDLRFCFREEAYGDLWERLHRLFR